MIVFGNCLFVVFLWVGFDIVWGYVVVKGDGFVGVVNVNDVSVKIRFVYCVVYYLVVVLFIDLLFVCVVWVVE